MEDSLTELDGDKASNILDVHYPYYKKLNTEQKQKFVTRVMEFIGKKDFLPRENVDISAGLDNIKVLISAAAVQLTFGLDKYLLDHFSKIFIYPSAYYNNMTKHWHKGETNVLGAIVFSWKDLQAVHDNDGINLGIHEMAHALLLGRRFGESNDEFFNMYFDKWWAVSNSEFLKLEKHETSMFRDYGGTNPQEFFAVCSECFFEIPERFKQEHPAIYRQTCILLNQDTAGNFDSLTQARHVLLDKEYLRVTPHILELVIGKENGNVLQLMGAIGGSVFALVVPFWAAVSSDSTGTGIFIACITLFIIGILYFANNYGVFYFYDNAFTIGAKPLIIGGERRQITFNPDEIVVIKLEMYSGNRSGPDYYLKIFYAKESEVVNERYCYNQLSDMQRETLEKMAQDFCQKHQIGFLKKY